MMDSITADGTRTVPAINAMLLLGPTGSGKTPLGHWIATHGINGATCAHFDFGENLRKVVAQNRPNESLTAADLDFLRNVLASGALLEDEHFSVAERILRSFLACRLADNNTWVVLNGLPRHVGQAMAIDAILDVRSVVCLECSADTVLRRLANNVGGDRGGRSDDAIEQVRRKLDTFDRRTAPLVEHYQHRGVPVTRLQVTPAMSAEQAWTILSSVLQIG